MIEWDIISKRINVKKILFICCMLLPLLAHPDILVEKQSHHSYKKTIQRFEESLKKKGLKIFCRIDHAKNASVHKMKLPHATLYLFGNPKMGTRLMQKDIRSALELPLKLLIYQRKGKTYLLYKDPIDMMERYHLPKRWLVKMSSMLRSLSERTTH